MGTKTLVVSISKKGAAHSHRVGHRRNDRHETHPLKFAWLSRRGIALFKEVSARWQVVSRDAMRNNLATADFVQGEG
jgi:hypothetical protein